MGRWAPLLVAFLAGCAWVPPAARRLRLKEELLGLVARTRRGADGQRNAEIQALFEELESLSPTAEPLESEELKGDWELLWTCLVHLK